MTATVESVRAELSQVFDPEIPVNIVDLGLIYDIQVDGSTCAIQMTLTSQACPEARTIPEVMKKRVMAMDGVEDVSIDIVWEPAWTPHNITPEGRKILGMEEPPAEPEPEPAAPSFPHPASDAGASSAGPESETPTA